MSDSKRMTAENRTAAAVEDPQKLSSPSAGWQRGVQGALTSPTGSK